MAVAGRVRLARAACLSVVIAAVAASTGCTTVDPGPNFMVPDDVFSADFFYCHVEPELIVARRCGAGDPSKGDPPNSCHYSAAVSGMQLVMHPAVDCGGGDHPVDTTQTGSGSAAQSNLQAASLEMSHDYRTAPIFVRPAGTGHPRAIFSADDPSVNMLLATWAK